MVETKIEIHDEEAPTTAEEMLLQNNDIALSAIHDALDENIWAIKNIERAHEQINNILASTSTSFHFFVVVFLALPFSWADKRGGGLGS